MVAATYVSDYVCHQCGTIPRRQHL